MENTETRVKTREKILELISANPNITNQELENDFNELLKSFIKENL